MHTRTFGIAALMAACLSACATQPYVEHLQPKQAALIKDPPVYVVAAQSELASQYLSGTQGPTQTMYVRTPQYATGSGASDISTGQLIGAGIVAGLILYGIGQHELHERLARRDRYLVQVQDALKRYDPRPDIESALLAAVQKQPWGTASALKVVGKLPESGTSPQGNVWITTDYALSPDFSQLVMRASVEIHGGVTHGLLYRNRLVFVSRRVDLPMKTEAQKQQLYAAAMKGWDQDAVNKEIEKLNREGVSAGAERDHMQQKLDAHDKAVKTALASQWTPDQAMQMYAEYWARDNGQALRSAVVEGTATLGEMLARDLDGGIGSHAAHVPGHAPMPHDADGEWLLTDGTPVESTNFGLIAHAPGQKVSPYLALFPTTL